MHISETAFWVEATTIWRNANMAYGNARAKQQLVEASEYHYMLGFLREFRDLAKSFRCTP